MIIKTAMYNASELKEIIKLRAKAEGVDITQDAMDKVAQIGSKTSLRYSCQLLTPSKIIASANAKEQVDVDDVEEASELFMDSKKSANLFATMGNDHKFIV